MSYLLPVSDVFSSHFSSTSVGQLQERTMRVASALVAIFVVPILLVSLTRGEGRSSCRIVPGFSEVLVRKENSDAVCLRRKWHMKCTGLCDSKSTVSVKDGVVRWNQDCECCQPVGYQSRFLNVSMPCSDGSTESARVRLVVPEICLCIDC